MDMETTATARRSFSAAAIGLIALGAAAIALVLFVRTFLDRPIEARLSVRVTSAQGIANGADVWMSGLRAGWVESETLQGDGSVVIVCAVARGVQLPAGAHVAVTTALFGDRRLEIVAHAVSRPEDVLPVGYVRAAEGLRTSPFAAFARAASLFQADVAKAAAHAERQRIRSRANAFAAPAFAPPRLRSPRIERPRHVAELDRILGDAQRMRDSAAAAGRSLAQSGARQALAQDVAELKRGRRALEAIRSSLPREARPRPPGV